MFIDRSNVVSVEVLIDFLVQTVSPGSTDWKPISPKSHFFPLCICLVYCSSIFNRNQLLNSDWQLSHDTYPLHESHQRFRDCSILLSHTALLLIVSISSTFGLIITTRLTRRGFGDIVSVTSLKLPSCSRISQTIIIGLKKKKQHRSPASTELGVHQVVCSAIDSMHWQ